VTVRDRLQRRVIPRLIVQLSTIRAPARLAAAARRLRERRGIVQLFVAFDDPLSAVALVELADRVRGRQIDLVVEPVVERGIPGDPAVDAKRRFAVVDAGRLAQRYGRTLVRDEPISAEDAAPLARQAAALQGEERVRYAVEAMQQLWFGASGTPLAGPEGETSEPAFKRRRLYDVPVAVVGGEWFFAHERLETIEERLDDLGWRAA
jgi:2-hydroxychromene-2-carboxylate isomerase